MYKVLLCMCRAIILLIKTFVLPRSCCGCRPGLLKVPTVGYGATFCVVCGVDLGLTGLVLQP